MVVMCCPLLAARPRPKRMQRHLEQRPHQPDGGHLPGSHDRNEAVSTTSVGGVARRFVGGVLLNVRVVPFLSYNMVLTCFRDKGGPFAPAPYVLFLPPLAKLDHLPSLSRRDEDVVDGLDRISCTHAMAGPWWAALAG